MTEAKIYVTHRSADGVSKSRQAPLVEWGDELQLHKHLPHHAVRSRTLRPSRCSAQPIDMSKPHPFTEVGNREFNSLVDPRAKP
jgi:hypothetical protein